MAHDRGAHPCYFSVIIPSYNRANLIGRAVNSVLRQTLTDYEVIVVDDASTDNTQQVVASYGERARILASAERRGPGAARNIGLIQARGFYAVFLDSDDLLLPWALATYKDAIERFDNPALVMGSFRRFRDEIELNEITAGPLTAEAWDDYLQPATAGYKILMAFAMRMDVLRESGGFAEQNICSEGHDLFLRIGTAKGFVYIHAPTLYAYRQHSVSHSRHITPLYDGARLMLKSEKRGVYPGGMGRRLERSIFLSRMLKYSIERCLEQGAQWHALELYLRALPYFRKSGYWPYNARPLAFIRKLRKRRRGPKGLDPEMR
jgi:glycosyltransferase involved in cell wall biosynthesis